MAADDVERAKNVMKRGAAVGLRVARLDEETDVYDVYDRFQRSGKPIASKVSLEKVEQIIEAAEG